MGKPQQFVRSAQSRAPLRQRSGLAVALLLLGCQGEIGPLGGERGGGEGAGETPSGFPPPDGPGNSAPPPGVGNPPEINDDGTPVGPLDVNRIPLRRLNNGEYDNTVHDLLGVASSPGRAFIEDEKALGFDVIASAFGMTDAQFEQYFEAADALVDEAFENDTLRGRILTCEPAPSEDLSCPKRIIGDFGQKAFRRPLEPAAVDRLAKLYGDARALGEDFAGGIRQVVKSMLSSVHFLYRVESDANPDSTEAHAVGPYELASRLSYLFWSTMPDDELFAAAKEGRLSDVASLGAQVKRMLADARAERFVESFAGQWLGMRDLESHQVEAGVYPMWSEELRSAMVAEGLLYFREFLSGGRSVTEFFTADVNFVSAPLAELYGFAAPGGASERVTNGGDGRRGFLGLASFLTLTSFSYRTAPTLRGKWVLENLLCQHIPPPPADVPKLDPEGADPASLTSENVRVRLEEHRKNPTCANCHKVLDPIGLGLENYDAIGEYRTSYANGDEVDASGVLPDGTTFEGLTELSAALAGDARFGDCLSEKLMTYALSRELVKSDTPYLSQIRKGWAEDGQGIAALLERIVVSDTFRFRRGEAP